MLIAELGLAPATREAWHGAGIRDTEHLRHPAVDLLALPGITGSILYETVRQLHEHHYGLPAYVGASRIMSYTADDLEMLRLRVVEGDSLTEIAETFRLSREGVRQRLRTRFGLSGEPSAARERRRNRLIMAPHLEQMLAIRLRLHVRGLSVSRLLAGFDSGVAGNETRAALRRMEAKGLLTIERERVVPTTALKRAAPNPRLTASGAGGGLERAGR